MKGSSAAVILSALLIRALALKTCENAEGSSVCGAEVVKAMVDGFASNPEKFIGLTVHSTYSDFQAYFHNTGMHKCPRPCLPQEEKCVAFGPKYPGLKDVRWVRYDGMINHPQWFPELSSDSTDVEIAKVLYMHGNKNCPRVCLADEEEGHSATQHEEKKKSKAALKAAEMEASESFRDCGNSGVTFSVMDQAGHLAETTPTSYACRTHCAETKATYFYFYEPTHTCHCPPHSAEIQLGLFGKDNIGGKVHCASIEYIKKISETSAMSQVDNFAWKWSTILLFVVALVSVALLKALTSRIRSSGCPEAEDEPETFRKLIRHA